MISVILKSDLVYETLKAEQSTNGPCYTNIF